MSVGLFLHLHDVLYRFLAHMNFLIFKISLNDYRSNDFFFRNLENIFAPIYQNVMTEKLLLESKALCQKKIFYASRYLRGFRAYRFTLVCMSILYVCPKNLVPCTIP